MGRTIVIDNGGGTARAGFAGDDAPRSCVPNTCARLKNQLHTLVADETVGSVKDSSQLIFQRPFDRGYVVNWVSQMEVWRRLFGRQHLNVAPADHSLLMTEAPFPPAALQTMTDEVVFEEFGFGAYYRCPAPALSVYYEQQLEDEREEALRAANAAVAVAGASTAAAYCSGVEPATLGESGGGASSDGGASSGGAGGSNGKRPASAPPPSSASTGTGAEMAAAVGAGAAAGAASGADGFATSDAMVVVDSGFSFTHVIAFHQGRAVQHSAQRINVGGKLMTNYLKEAVSYRQWNMMDEFQLMDDVRQQLSFVSLDFSADLAAAGGGPRAAAARRLNRRRAVAAAAADGLSDAGFGGSGSGGGDSSGMGASGLGVPSVVREFVLPDHKTVHRGYAREPLLEGGDGGLKRKVAPGAEEDELQVLRMGCERFTVPELLFRPSDVGIQQAGVGESVARCVAVCDPALRPGLFANVLLTGGNALIPNYQARVHQEVRARAPDYCVVGVRTAIDPLLHAWRGGSRFGASREFGSFAVTRAEYNEYGHRICAERFADW